MTSPFREAVYNLKRQFETVYIAKNKTVTPFKNYIKKKRSIKLRQHSY